MGTVWIAGSASFCCLLLLLAPARAQFAICNQTLDMVNVAIGYDRGTGGADSGPVFVSEGWWTIGPNQCASVIRTPLSSRYIYVHAQDALGRVILGGEEITMCIQPAKFVIEGFEDCWMRGLIAAPVQTVDTLRAARWTLFLTEGP